MSVILIPSLRIRAVPGTLQGAGRPARALSSQIVGGWQWLSGECIGAGKSDRVVGDKNEDHGR